MAAINNIAYRKLRSAIILRNSILGCIAKSPAIPPRHPIRPPGFKKSPPFMTPAPLRPQTSVPYSETRMRQPARRPGDSCPDRHPPQPRRGRAPGAKTDTAMPNPIRNRRRTTIGEQPFGLTKRASRKRPNPCRNPISAGPASSLCVSYGPCSSVPASGCHHRPVPV